MKKILFSILCLGFSTFCYSQEATSLKIFDTRDIIDNPGFVTACVRADFKKRSIIGAPGTGNFSTNITIAPRPSVEGGAHHQLNINDGGIFLRSGIFNSNLWGEWNKVILGDANGVIQSKLDVNGTIRATEVKVEALPWSDFVFDKDYKLPTLQEVENHINKHKHLPDIPSEAEVKENGVSLGEIQAKLLQKIEELTLYVIKQDKAIKEQEEKMNNQAELIKKLQARSE